MRSPHRSCRSSLAAMSISVAMLSLSGLCAAQAGPTPPLADAGAFTEHVAGQLRQELGADAVKVTGPLQLSVSGLPTKLDRIYADCQRTTQTCGDMVRSFVRTSVQDLRDRTLPPNRDALRLVVRTAAHIQRLQGSTEAVDATLHPAPVVGPLVSVAVFDSPGTVRMLGEKDYKTLKLATAEVRQIAAANTQRAFKPILQDAPPVASGQVGRINGSEQPSRLLFPQDWQALADAQHGRLLVAVPATDVVLYISDDTPLAIDGFRSSVHELMGQAARQLSDTVLRWTPGGWVVVN